MSLFSCPIHARAARTRRTQPALACNRTPRGTGTTFPGAFTARLRRRSSPCSEPHPTAGRWHPGLPPRPPARPPACPPRAPPTRHSPSSRRGIRESFSQAISRSPVHCNDRFFATLLILVQRYPYTLLGLALGLTPAHVTKVTLQYFKTEYSHEVTLCPHSCSL